ncbi:MAG: haloacid dehalogenase type II [Bryobacterales bacterium]|nr:haloacid dehalogenase type II [Bryobacterales bacterium]
MPRVLVFDVNETLLDLRALEPHFARLFGDQAVLLEWFNQVILFSEAVTLAGNYKNFGEVARAALEMTAAAHGKELSAEAAQQIIGGIRNLPPHPEVPESLARLKVAGFQMVTLTNSPPAVAEAQIANANLKPFFTRIFSVDSVQRFKPAPEPYRMVARELGVETSQLRMIAAHAWDVGGAMQAGCAAAFIARPGKALFPAFPKPDIIGHDLRDVTEAILLAEKVSAR